MLASGPVSASRMLKSSVAPPGARCCTRTRPAPPCSSIACGVCQARPSSRTVACAPADDSGKRTRTVSTLDSKGKTASRVDAPSARSNRSSPGPPSTRSTGPSAPDPARIRSSPADPSTLSSPADNWKLRPTATGSSADPGWRDRASAAATRSLNAAAWGPKSGWAVKPLSVAAASSSTWPRASGEALASPARRWPVAAPSNGPDRPRFCATCSATRSIGQAPKSTA